MLKFPDEVNSFISLFPGIILFLGNYRSTVRLIQSIQSIFLRNTQLMDIVPNLSMISCVQVETILNQELEKENNQRLSIF